MRELHILGQGVNIQQTIARAERAIAIHGLTLRFAFRLLYVERGRDLHLVFDGAAVAVEIVGCVDAIGLRPGDLRWDF